MNPDDLLENLDPEQREAASSLVGPTCILAGAGTGKTRTITHRIAYGIAKGYYAANRVLALTYTNRAAGELRQRLRALGVGAVSVKTFHAAALSQLEYFWPQFAGVPAPQVIESKARLLLNAAESLKLQLDAATIRDLAAEVEWRKYSMLTMDEYAEAAKSRPQPGGMALARNLELQVAYEEGKIKAQKIDWEDVLVLTLGLLRAEPRALAHVQQQYRFFTVDEYQDISPLQQALLDTWLGDHSEICVVGDPNQTIYSFTGASSEFLHGFKYRYQDATVVELTRNYRSTQQILSFANRLTAQDQSLQPLQAQSAPGQAPEIIKFATLEEEAKQVATRVSQQIAQGTHPSEIAILYRVNGQSESFEKALADLGIDYQLRGGVRFFARPEIQDAMRAVRAEAISNSGRPLFQAVSDICRSLGWQTQEPESGNALRERWESLNAFMGILDEMPADATIHEFSNELEERMRSQHEPLRAAVTLSTIHAAKGLEWNSVFLVGLTDGYLPIAYAKTDAEIAEEKRLLYVGLTRAKRELQLSWAENAGAPRSPSRFLKLLTPAQG